MDWIKAIEEAVEYIEANICEDITVSEIAKKVAVSPYYFQKGFSLLCGFTVSDYIRKRRLSLAGNELAFSDIKVIDLAVKFGYDSPDSFTKAFTRFHGVTPAAAKRNGTVLKSFAPLKIKISLEGGHSMDYKIIKKAAFTVVGFKGTFPYENAKTEVPKFWSEHYASGRGKEVCGMYAINRVEDIKSDTFEYLIADHYDPSREYSDTAVIEVIPGFTWAVFPCKGKMPDALGNMNDYIFSQWLPSCKDYEIAAGYCIELYDDPKNYKNGTLDDEYYSEMWIPVKRTDK